MKLYILSDGWPAYLQADGSLSDHPDPKEADLGWESLDEIKQWDPDVRLGTKEDKEYYEKHLMKDHQSCLSLDFTWSRPTCPRLSMSDSLGSFLFGAKRKTKITPVAKRKAQTKKNVATRKAQGPGFIF